LGELSPPPPPPPHRPPLPPDAPTATTTTTANDAARRRCGRRRRLDLVSTIGATQIEAVAAASELINSSGLALIQAWELDPHSHTLIVQMGQCLRLVLTCLSYDSIDVSGAVIELVSRILVSIERNGEEWNSSLGGGGRGIVGTMTMTTTTTTTTATTTTTSMTNMCDEVPSRILRILHARMRYPDDPNAFECCREDEAEAEEEVYRSSLRKVYQRIVGLRPHVALSYACACLGNLLAPSPSPPSSSSSSSTPRRSLLSSSSPSDVEVALRLVFHYAEGRRPSPGARTALGDGRFREIIAALHRSDVSTHPHWAVLLLYFDVAVRYSDVLKGDPELLSLVLGSLYGNGGLRHPRSRVRCRSCYLLLRLIKAVGPMSMRPHVEAAVDGMQLLLSPPPASIPKDAAYLIPPDEALYLFEATGILLGTTGLDREVQVRCAAAVLTPHIRSIEQSLRSPDLARDVETYGERLSMSISAIAQLSKGWQKSPPPEVQAVLAAAVDVCRMVLESLPSSLAVRNRTAVLLQRMILCLGEGILPVMPSFFAPLLAHCESEEDVLDASQLINQLCIKFKEKAAAAVDAAVIPFLRKVLTIQIGSGHDMNGNHDDVSPPAHLISHRTEQLFIRKQAFSTLQHIAVHNVSAVLYSERNVSSLGDVLQLMVDGISVPDPVMKKTCVQFFCELIKQWGGCQSPVPPTVSDAFIDFVYNAFVPGMLSCALDPTFNVKDALNCRVLAEFSRALWLLKLSRRGDAEFQGRVVDNLILRGDSWGRKDFSGIASGFQSATCEKDVELMLKTWKEELARQ
jgi:exportin-T